MYCHSNIIGSWIKKERKKQMDKFIYFNCPKYETVEGSERAIQYKVYESLFVPKLLVRVYCLNFLRIHPIMLKETFDSSNDAAKIVSHAATLNMHKNMNETRKLNCYKKSLQDRLKSF